MTHENTLPKLLALIAFSAVLSYSLLRIFAQFVLAMIESFINYGTTVDLILALITIFALGWILLYAFVKLIQNM